ncbi:MAG: guanylate kinase [Bacteriovoracaceae bacterium]|nr:guanylate kinase [Bacteriovoracaceae bacterium]
MKKGKIVIIVAPSGSGKSTLIKKLKAELPELVESVSFTTRPIRDGEVDGVSYNFIDENLFKSKIESNDFLEWAKVHGNYYGTEKSFVESEIKKGVNLLFDLDVQGTDSFKSYFKDEAKAIFIAPPSIVELESRLRNRGTETTGIINLRIENSKKEILRKDDYDHCVVNDNLDRAFGELRDLVRSILEEN